jgi:excinuclease ABC subunit B
MYADNITGSIERAIKETDRRRAIQVEYNKVHHITPRTIVRKISSILPDIDEILKLETAPVPRSKTALQKLIADKQREMRTAAAELNFEMAGILRDEIRELNKKISEAEEAAVAKAKEAISGKPAKK